MSLPVLPRGQLRGARSDTRSITSPIGPGPGYGRIVTSTSASWISATFYAAKRMTIVLNAPVVPSGVTTVAWKVKSTPD